MHSSRHYNFSKIALEIKSLIADNLNEFDKKGYP